jgi:two-component system sensor histidine kinase EvgS
LFTDNSQTDSAANVESGGNLARPGIFRSLKLRFIIYSITAMLVVAGVVTLLMTSHVHSNFEQQYQQHLDRMVAEQIEELRMVILSGQPADIDALLARIAAKIDAGSIRLVDESGNITASYRDETRERRQSSISFHHDFQAAGKDGSLGQWQLRLRVRPDTLSGVADSFMLQQLLVIMFMLAAAVVGIAFALEITVSRRITEFKKHMKSALDTDISAIPAGNLRDEFSELDEQLTSLVKICQQKSNSLKVFADTAEMVCFTVDLTDESVAAFGDSRKLLGIDPGALRSVSDFIKLMPATDEARLRQRWLSLRTEVLSGKSGSGRRDSLWQLSQSGLADAGMPAGEAWIRVLLQWSGGDDRLIYGVITDATDKKVSETGLKVELENFRSIYMNLPVGLWRSYNDRFISMNKAMAQILGYKTPQEAIDKVQSIGHQLYLTPVDRSFFFDELRKRDQMRSLEMKFHRANGELFWAAVFGRVFYENGREYCEGCFIDITDKRQAEEKLRLNEEILRQSIESGDVVAWQFEPVSEQFLLFGAVKRMLGGSMPLDPVFKNFCKVIHSEDLHAFKLFFDKSRRSDVARGVCPLDFRICILNREKMTEVRHLRLLTSAAESLLASSQRVIRGVMIDVTDLVQTEMARKSGDDIKFEGMDTAELFTSMSHEIRTPLSAIIGYSELLVPIAENERVKHYASSIIAAGRSLINIINSIHDLVRLESGQVELIEGPLNPADLLAEVDSMFSEEAERKNLEFWVQVDSEVPSVILSDEARIREILINLVSNAIKFTNHGSVGVRVALGHLSQQNLINLLITVEDTGVGIDCENPEQIFDPLYRRKFQNRFGGTGLGLAICRRLVELLNGTIKVKTELEKGTRFDIILRDVKLPERSKKQIAADAARKGMLKFSGQKIMVADDTASNRELIAEAMKNAGLKVVCASDGNEAVELAKKELPELIFMDLRMPQKDGVSAARELRCISGLASVPIIAVTATNSFAELEELKGLFDGFIIKPVSLLRLFSEVGRFLSHVASAEPLKETEYRLPPEAFEQLSNPWQLCEVVSKEFMSGFTHADNAILIDEMADLAERVRHASIEHSFNILTLEAEALIGSLKSYDITAIKKSRNRINTIFCQLLKVYSRR